ncbi:MAG: hypothetical protein LBJ25_01430 [Candidatus Margulisbacteria bacterium]|jgi:hypothetical protein|nr:hypothetical protein [Candidatus Margulisiibacteriota bacterium]
MKKILKKLRAFWWSGEQFQPQKIHRNYAKYETKQRLENPIYLERYGFKVFSQNDEDGIIEEIFNRIGTTNKKFVEFGVQNGLESNTHFLLHKGWKGVWIEGNKRAVEELRLFFKKPLKDSRLSAINAFITAANINQLISLNENCSGEIDLLSIDIDGNDYWVWEAISCIKPRVVVIEYNAKFPPAHEWVMKYDEKHIWSGDDEQGASLKSLELLGEKLGYQLVGTNMTGTNAFFVKKELAKNLFPQPAKAENLYNPTRWDMRYVSGHPAKKYIGN